MNNAFGQKTPPRAASTMYHRMDDEGDVLAARPLPLVEVRPQEWVQRPIAEQIVETFVPLQVLDAPVPQMETQLVEFTQKLDTANAEQVIEVPKLSQDRIPQRFAVRRPQKAEQLVEVPTVLSFSSLQQQSAEQIIDIPAHRRCRRRGQGGLHGLRPDQSSTASLSSAERISERIVKQNVDIPVSGGGLHVLPDPGGSSSSAVSRDERGDGFFGLFPGSKKVRRSPPVRVRGCPPGRAHGLLRLTRGVRLGTLTCMMSTLSTTTLCGSRLGTISTSATAGAKFVVKRATASCRFFCRFWSSSSALSDLEPPRCIVMAL